MFITQLQEEIQAITELHQLLQQEYSALEVNSLADLVPIIDRKRTCMTRLQSLTEQRLRQINAADAADFDSAAYLSQAPSEQRDQLKALWSELQKLGEQTRWQNEVNGAIIASSHGQVQRALTLLHGRDPHNQLYDRDAQMTSDGGSHASVKA